MLTSTKNKFILKINCAMPRSKCFQLTITLYSEASRMRELIQPVRYLQLLFAWRLFSFRIVNFHKRMFDLFQTGFLLLTYALASKSLKRLLRLKIKAQQIGDEQFFRNVFVRVQVRILQNHIACIAKNSQISENI